MFTNNAFAAAAQSLPAGFMQWFLVLMVVAVIAGTLADMVHKGSATYFFANWRKPKGRGSRKLAGGELASIAVQTVVVDVMTSGEFCNPRRRIAHLLTMYGFVIYLVTTALMVFWYPTPATPTPDIVPLLWWIGGLMVLVGGYWFWFFIRVDVAAEGNPALRLVRADLFVLSLLASVTLAVIWAAAGRGPGALFWLYLLATAVLFGSVAWSKFAHMFFKPAAAFEKRMANANGTRTNLPAPADQPEKFGARVKHARNY
jgi:hypothetical protein